MKKIVLFLIAILATVMPMRADYTLQFVESSSSSDSTTPYGDDVPSVFLSEGTSVVASVTSNKKVYPGKTGYGAKFGSSTTAGEMTIGLHQLFAEARIKVAPYSSTGSVMVKLNEAEYEVSKSADGDFVEIFYAPEAGFTTLTITSTAATNARFYVKSITLSETASGPNGGGTGALRGNAVWPIFMDGITRQQESSKIVADFTNDEQERNFYIWNNTYQGENVYGGNFYDNGDVYMSLTVQNEGWSGFGMNILAGNNSWDAAVNLWQNIHSNPEKYYLHLALKSTDYASHDFYVFDDLTTRFTIGTSPQDSSSVIIGDFARDGEWHEFDIPMSMFAMSPDFTSTDGMNIFVALSGGVAGTQLNLDAVYFYEVSDSQTDKGEGDVPPITGEYTLKFVESGSQTDISQTYANNVDAIFQNGAGVVADVTSVNAVFAARTGWGAKFGSNSKIGELTVSLENSSYVGAKLMVMPYMSGSSSLISVNGTELETPVVNDSSFVEVVYTSNEILTSLEIKGVPTSASSTISPRSRFYLQSITLLQTGDAGNQGSGTSDPCAIKSFPWEENFDVEPITADEVIPTCWDNNEASQSMSQSQKWSYYKGTLNSQCVRFDSYNAQTGEWNILKTPTMTLPQGMALFVKYKNPSGGDFNINMYGADGATTTLKSGLVDVANWRVEKIDLSQYAGQMVSFGFEGVSNWGNGDAYIYIDKVAVMSNTQELDTESDPDFGPQIIIEEYQTLSVAQARIGRIEPGWYDVSVINMKTLPTVTSMNPDLLRIDSVRFVDGAGEAVSNPADAVSLRIHYATTPTMLGYLEGTINIVAGEISATLPFAVNVTEVYELVPLNQEEALHLTAAPGEMLTFTLKFMHTGFTPDQVSAGFPYGVSTEGYELGQLYSLNDTVMALDVRISGRKNGVYSTEVMLEAHAGVCFSDVTAYVRFETKISDSWIQKLTKEINFGVLPLNSGVYADTVYLKYHNVNLDSVVVGVNILPYDGEPYIPCGVGDVVVLNDSMMSVLVECNTNIVEVGPGSYSLRFYYVVYDDNVVTDEDTDIPVKMTFVAPEFRIAEELDFGTMLFDETKSMKLQFEAQYYDISDIEVSSFSDILTVSDVIEIVDSTASTSQGAWKKYEVTVTLNAYEVGNLYQDIFYRFKNKDGWVTVKAFIPQPTVTIMQEAYDFGKVPQNSGAYPAEILVTFSNALPERIGYGIRNQNEADTSWVPVGFADRVLRDSTTLVVNMMLNSDGMAIGKYDWFFFVSYGKEISAIPVMANIVQASQIEIIPEVIDFGDVPFSSLVNDYISTEVKIATTSVHQAVASIEGDSAFSLSKFNFGPTESYFGNRLEQDLTIYALPDRMGQHMAELKLNGDSGRMVTIAQVMMNVVPREVLYDTIRATICDNETYPFDGKMLNVAGTYSETTKTIYGGDSITTLILTVLPTLYGDVYATIRDYEVYTFHGDTIREAGDFRYPMSQASSTGCDSMVTLHLTVLETMYRTEEATICSNQSYTFYGDEYAKAGTYTHRIENTQLGDSVITLNLTVLPTKTGEESATIRDYEWYHFPAGSGRDSTNVAGDYTYTLVAANGCDSVVTLHLTVLETKYRTEDVTICANQSYTFYGQEYAKAGKYEHRIENEQLGDSVITLNLTVLPTKVGEEFATIRDYEQYDFNGVVLTKAGEYIDTLVAANGCDSVVTLHLTVLETMYRTEDATICANQSYTFYGQEYAKAGKYEHRIENEQLGDSVITLNLTVLPTKTGEEFATIRDYEWYVFPVDANRDSTNVGGDYEYTLVAANGCDSVVTLHLTVLETMYRTENATICANQSYTFYDEVYSQAGKYEHRIENTQLGDSVITLNLTVLPTKTGEEFATIRDYEQYDFNGVVLTKAGEYIDTLVAANGCDSVVTLHLMVLETMYRTEDATICANQSYTFYGQEYAKAGKYEHRIENEQLGDSVITLNLTVLPTKVGEEFATIRDYEAYYYQGDSLRKAGNYEYTLVAANGCDSVVTLNLTVLETMYRTEDATICANQSYTFYGQEYAKAGKYEHRIENEQLGDSVITLNLIVLPTKTGEDFATIRDYEMFYYEGDSLNKAGDYTYTLVAANGCDSVVTLHLNVLATMYRTEEATICANQSYTFYGDAYTEAGTYTHRIENTQLGDSVITLNLTVLPTKIGEASATIRDYEMYFYEGDSLSKAGDYTYTLVASNGCDSTVTLHLTVLETKYRTEEATICSNQSYTFYGDAYTEAGQYTHRIENTQLGDSVITLNLTVLPTKTGEVNATIRDYEEYEYEGQKLTEAGNYEFTLVAANGCDSVVTLHLTVLETMYRTEDATICANQSYTFYGEVYSQAGKYEHRIENTQLGDSVITLNLTVLPTKTGEEFATIRDYEWYVFPADANRDSTNIAGDYTYTLVAANGCDSTVTLHLTVLETKYRTEEATICANQSYTFYGEKYSQAGQYTHRIENTQLGDSVITLNLTVLPTKSGEDFATIRDYEWYVFPVGANRDSTNIAGDYTYTLVAANGCDSVVTLHLTVLETMYRTENATICANQSYTFYDEVYSQAGKYEHRIENTQLGDSVITLNLTVLPTKTGEDFATIRDYEWYVFPVGANRDSTNVGGDYEYTLVAANGCDSVVTLHLTVLETMYRTEEATICSNSSYTFYGEVYSEAGKYEHRIENTQLGDSVITLNLTVLPTKTGEVNATIRDYEEYEYEGQKLTEAGNYEFTLVAANGCDSVVTLHLTVLETKYRTEDATICSNQSYTFYGDEYAKAGTYTHRIENTQLGDSVITLNLTVLPTKTGEDFATIRDYEEYEYEGQKLTEAGNYEFTLVAANGCDSVVTLHLTVLETMYRTEEATICSNQSYTFYGDEYAKAGTYTHRIENTQLGDSVITLNLTVLPTKTGEEYATIRDYEWYVFPVDANRDSTNVGGDYEYTLVAANGCDSVVTLHLTVLETMYRTEEATICANQSYIFYGDAYTEAGTYTHRIENAQLGDSVITLNLTVLPTKTGEVNATIRDYEEYEYEGQKLTEAGNYEFTLVAANGCDSVVTLHLTVLETMYRTEEATICSNSSYTFYGEVYNQAGKYEHRIENTQLGDSVITLNLTVLPTKIGEEFATIRDYEWYVFPVDANRDSTNVGGDYEYTLVAANGCDSVVTLHLTVLETMYRTENATICANQSYTFYDEVYSQAGKYEHRIENTQLGDSVITLNLTVLPTKTGEVNATIRDYEAYYYQGDSLRKAGNYEYTLVAANGCDSTVTLHLTVLETKYRTEEATICSNQSYTFYGDAYTEAGQYTHRIENTQLGDSVITLNLTVLPTKTGEDFATIRDYEWYHFPAGSGRDSTNVAGDYTYTLVATNGCDSTVTLHLTVLETKYRTEDATICSNQSYTFYGDEYTKAGTYTHRIENTQLGDSVITLNLTVLPTKTGEENATIRDYEWYVFPVGANRDSTNVGGDYEYTLVAENGCDSTVTLHLTVLETMYRTEEATICSNSSYTFYGDAYTEAGTYTHRIENTQLGDSVITLNLTVLPTKTGEESATIRDYEWYVFPVDANRDSVNVGGDYEYTLVAANGCDSTVTLHLTVLATVYDTISETICSNSSYTFYGDAYTEAGQYTHRIENTQLGDSVITLNLSVLPTATTELEVTIIEPETYWFGGKELTETGVYVDTLVTENGCDSVVTLSLYVIPSCSEYVIVNAPEEVVYYGDSTEFAPVVELICPSRDAAIEWGHVMNYNPNADGKVDVTNPVEYVELQFEPMANYSGDTLSSRFNNYILDRTQYFYYQIWQCDTVKEMHLFRFEHVGQVNSIWVNYDAPKRDQLISSDATISVDGGEAKTVTVAWYNTQDTVNVATGNFVHGQTYYAVVTTPMTEILGENYHIDATTTIVWGEEQQPKALTNGQLQSPMYTMENVTWTFRLEDAMLAPDGQASINACAEPSVLISGSNSVVLNWELSTDNQNWLTLTDTLGYNIDVDSYCTDIHFPATLLRAGTYYIRVRAQYQGETFYSRTAELVIQAGIVMAEEAVQQTTVTETGEEVAAVQYMFDEQENVGVLTLTNSTNEGSATTAVAITSNTVVEIVGTNTVVSDEAGFESSGDLEFVGRIDSTQVDEVGNTIYVAMDSMSIVSRRPLYAPGQGVKVTFNGVYMVLAVSGHEDDNLIPSRSAARAQQKRAYRIAHAALEAAGEESVISGFDEADFINCGIIEPEGAEYDGENNELMNDGDPVYNCTIVPIIIPEDPMSTGMVKDVVRAEKRIVNDVIYIFRQGKTYTMMGQTVE